MSLHALTEEDLQRIEAADAGNVVYRQQDKELAPSEQISMAVADEIMQKIRAIYVEARRVHPDRSDDDIRQDIKTRDPAFKSFAERSHATTFSLITKRGTTDAHLDLLRRMKTLCEGVEEGKIDRATANLRVQKLMLGEFGSKS